MSYRYTYSPIKGADEVANTLKRDSPDTRQVSGFLLPDGRVSVGVVPRRAADLNDTYDPRSKGVVYRRQRWDYQDGLVADYVSEPLGLSSVPIHHNRSESERKAREIQYGIKGISQAGKQAICQAGYLLEKYYTTRRLGFYTLTCPYKDDVDVWYFNLSFAEIMRRYFQEMKREYARFGLKWRYVAAYEFQPKRFEREGVAALHVHYVAPCYLPHSTTFVVSANTIRRIWARVCTQVVGVEACTNASVDAQIVRKSVSGYLSKYLSKGGDMLSRIAEISPEIIPRRWWGMSAQMRADISANTVKLPEAVALHLYCGGDNDPKALLHLTYKQYIYVCIHGEEKKMGMVGRLCKAGMSALQPEYVWDEFDQGVNFYYRNLTKLLVASYRECILFMLQNGLI
jgi:hypothetical protein